MCVGDLTTKYVFFGGMITCIAWSVLLQKVIAKNEALSFTTKWMQFEAIMLSEICQSSKDEYHVFSLTCGNQYTGYKKMYWNEIEIFFKI